MPRTPRWIAVPFGLLAALPVGALVLGALIAPATRWGVWLVGALALGVVGLITAPLRARRARGLTRGAAALLALYAAARLGCAAGGPHTTMVTLPGAAPGRWIDRVVDEADLTVLGARVLGWSGRYPEDASRLPGALREAYAEMRAAEGALPSPVAATLLGLQRPAGSDTLVVAPPAAAAPRVGLVFLHGFAGNFTVQCWHAAQAARAIGALVLCPSVGVDGRWTGHAGARTVGLALDELARRGVRRVYLAGLSNGAVGAHALAARFAPRLAGVILISGGAHGAAAGGLPTLVVRGRDDRAAGGSPSARAGAARDGGGGAGRLTVAVFAGGHFVFLERRLEVRAAIARWLRAREGRAAPAAAIAPARAPPHALGKSA